MRGPRLWHRIIGLPARLWHEVGKIAETLSDAGYTRSPNRWRDRSEFDNTSAGSGPTPEDHGSSRQTRI